MISQRLRKPCFFCLCFLLMFGVLHPFADSEDTNILLLEEFEHLDNWEPFYFPKIKEHSTYTIGENNVLKAESHASASAIMYKERFDVYEHPLLEWRWKVENVYEKGDAKKKSGDDYPIRIYIVFEYDPKKAGFRKRLKYKTAKALYGQYPPHGTLNYIWANREHNRKIIPNPFTDKAMMIIMESGHENADKWINESVNIIDDYKKAFGEAPPEQAGLAIMCDADNTGEKAESFVDYIEISGLNK